MGCTTSWTYSTCVRWKLITCWFEPALEQTPYTGQITEIAPYVRTYLWVTIWYKYNASSLLLKFKCWMNVYLLILICFICSIVINQMTIADVKEKNVKKNPHEKEKVFINWKSLQLIIYDRLQKGCGSWASWPGSEPTIKKPPRSGPRKAIWIQPHEIL